MKVKQLIETLQQYDEDEECFCIALNGKEYVKTDYGPINLVTLIEREGKQRLEVDS